MPRASEDIFRTKLILEKILRTVPFDSQWFGKQKPADTFFPSFPSEFSSCDGRLINIITLTVLHWSLQCWHIDFPQLFGWKAALEGLVYSAPRDTPSEEQHARIYFTIDKLNKEKYSLIHFPLCCINCFLAFHTVSSISIATHCIKRWLSNYNSVSCNKKRKEKPIWLGISKRSNCIEYLGWVFVLTVLPIIYAQHI